MKAVLASPSYGPVDPHCARALRTALMSAARHGTEWLGDASPDRLSYGSARNLAVESVFEWAAVDWPDFLVWVDSDILCEATTLWQLLDTAERFGHDFVSGVYHHRRGGNGPVIYKYTAERDTFRQMHIYQLGQVVPVDGCGFGICCTSMKMLAAIKTLPEFDPKGGKWFPDRREGHGKFGEDLGCCRLAMKAGIKLYCDTGIQVGHMGEAVPITRETFLKTLADGKEPVVVEEG